MSALIVVATGNIGPHVVRELVMLDGEAEHFAEMYEPFARHESEFVTDTVERVTGRPARTIEPFLDDLFVLVEQPA